MKKFVLFVVVIFAVAALFGCGKKKKTQEAALDNMTNGVVSENVVSVTDMTASNAVSVVVDNAEAIPQTTGEMAAGTVSLKNQPTAKEIQQALKNAGFYTGKVDGTIGSKTKKAIKDFQDHNGLKADGKVGPKTWKILSTHLNQTSEVANPTAQAQTVGQ